MAAERSELTKRTQLLSKEELCSQTAVREINRQVKDLLTTQVSVLYDWFIHVCRRFLWKGGGNGSKG